MTVTVNGTTGVSLIQDGTVTSAKIVDGAVTPADTQVGALPSMVRLNTANGYGSTNTKIRRFTNVVTNQGTDITYADSATLGASFTINANGVYAVSYVDQFTVAEVVGLSLNTTQPTVVLSGIPLAEVLNWTTTSASGSATATPWTRYLPSGSVVRPHNNSGITGINTNACQFTLTRVA